MTHTVRMLLPILLVPVLLFGQNQENVGDLPDGNRSTAVHLIKIYDEFDHVIKMDEKPVMAFSTKQTCAKCHEYEKIRRGWHFNAADSGTSGGRVGEPWILVDRWAAVQVPLSYRGWKGTYRPDSLGITTFQFLTLFGRHLPGGGVGENEGLESLDDYMRWQVSGALDVNCQSCHNADPTQNQAEYGVQVLRQNFRWAAASGSGFALVQGSASEMADSYDLYSAVAPEKSSALPPTVTYDQSRFDRAGRVLFNVPRRMPPGQCYFCHSSKIVDPARSERWEGEEDVHIARGMTCVDCHRNGLDHQMIRGYEGEAETTGRAAVASLTCQGCHLGATPAAVPREGRRGAPRPQHTGIPPVHFQRLACTACHSGPWPSDTTMRVKTSRAHALGIPKTDKADDALPRIAAPVFVKQEDGRYAPHNAVWPAYWAYRRADGLEPVPPSVVRPWIADIYNKDTSRAVGRWAALRDSDIVAILGWLRERDTARGTPLYVGGGKVFLVGRDGSLRAEGDDAAKAYLWPIAHDVRPKAQSLGIRGCSDCHASDAAFHFGSVEVTSPFVTTGDLVERMTAYQDQSPVFPWLFSKSFLFRPALKVLVIVCFVLMALVVVLYSLRGLARIIKSFATEEE